MPAANDSKAIQRAFRILLQAMAHPGEIHLLPPDVPNQGLPLVAQTLLDHEVGFAVIGPDSESLASSLRDLTRSRLTDISAADFVVVAGGGSRGGILEVKRGSLEYPDRGATVIYLVEELSPEGTAGLHIRLKGPGIKEETGLVITGLDDREMIELKQVNQDFPLGVDCFLLDKRGRIAGIPRSNSVEAL